ncbi:MAG: endonuclease [bacterium]
MRVPSPHRSLFALLFLFTLLFGCSHEPNPLQPPLPGTGSDLQIKAAPAGYYDSVDSSTPAAMRASLHAVIDDHTRIPYTATGTDTWDVLELADEDPNDSGRILDIYLNASYVKYGEGNLDYNREHSWPKSYGFPNDVVANYPYTDCHHLFLANDSYNTSRSNKPFRSCASGCTEKPTLEYNGVGGGTGVYPGNSNWTSGSFTEGSWETWIDRRGDVARALFYLDVRYEGGVHGVTGYSEPDLILTDDEGLIAASNTGANEAVGYMGMVSVLLQWHQQDPVDAKEASRNDVVYSFQGNRNPFIDHPEWVDCIFAGNCGGGGDTTPPAAPTGLVATPGDGSVGLDWVDNGEPDLMGYAVYRATASGGPYAEVTALATGSQFTDSGLTGGVTYYYVVTAKDSSGNESPSSPEVQATPTGGGGGGPAIWINEFHYDNDGTDTGEFFEIAGPAGADLSGWSVIGYNGNGGLVYDTVNLAGTLPDLQNGFGVLAFPMTGMQNGSPDGLALVDGAGTVVMFISYEGLITAVDGPAAGMASTDIGVSEPADSPVGWTLQLAGDGSAYGDFTWQAPGTGTEGAVNTGQTFAGGGPVNQDPAAQANGPYSGEKGVAVAFSSAGSQDPDGSIAGYLWDFGDGATSTLADPGHAYASTGVFTVTLTVTDDQGATGVDVTSATISDTTAPAAPVGLGATPGDGSVGLVWDAVGDADLAGYTVYRGDSSGGPYTSLHGGLVTATSFTDATAANGTTYYYVVTASDGAGNESAYGNETSATPQASGGGGGPLVWINEFHYDNDGADRNEFVEVAGPAGTDLTGWTVVGYNGADGSAYLTVGFSGALADQQGGFGVQAAAMVGMQNGSPDGLALVDPQGAVIQFLSYEGSFTASGGPAGGMTSTDIGISEPDTAPRRTSLQLAGSGSAYADFTWEGPLGKTDGSVNVNQVFIGSGGGDTTAPAAPTGLAANAGDGFVDLDWADNGEADLAGYTVYRAESSGGPYSALTGSLLASSAYTDNAVTNGTTYYYVVTATDVSGNESGDSAEIQAAPSGGGTTIPMHVAAIDPSATLVRNKEYGHAAVLVVDDLGNPVAGASVTGSFSGSISSTESGVTGADGWIELTCSSAGKPGISFTFCVTGISLAGYAYDSGANVETCDGI